MSFTYENLFRIITQPKTSEHDKRRQYIVYRNHNDYSVFINKNRATSFLASKQDPDLKLISLRCCSCPIHIRKAIYDYLFYSTLTSLQQQDEQPAIHI